MAKAGSAFCPFHGGRSPGSATQNPDVNFQAALEAWGGAGNRKIRISLLILPGKDIKIVVQAGFVFLLKQSIDFLSYFLAATIDAALGTNVIRV